MSFHPNDVARRGRVAALLLCGALFFLLTAFFRSQVLNNEQWTQKSEEQHFRRLPIPAPRGPILDRNGKIIAESAVAYSVSFLATTLDTLKATLARLGAIVPIDSVDYRKALRRFDADRGRPTVIFDDAQFDKVSVLEEHRIQFPSLVIQPTPKRVYPAGEAVGAFVGYTVEVTEKELETKAESGYKSGQQIGRTGLEQQYESMLRGQEGASVVQVDAHMRVVGGENVRLRKKAIPGKPLKTTIDLDLQQFVHDLFADSALVGAIVAMDPKTGDVLALHSSPTVDPNAWIGGISVPVYDQAKTDPRRPLVNKALKGLYPPGSTFKLATSIIALQEGLIKPTDHMPQSCGGSYTVGNHTWACWDPKGHGSLDLTGAILKSCDVYFYQLGLKLAIARLVAGGVDLGFATRTGIDLPEESAPRFPRLDSAKSVKAYYDARFGANNWGTPTSEVLNLSIGQGANSQTVVNMARFYAALANGGMSPTPHLAAGEPVLKPLFKVDDADMLAVHDAMMGVLEAGGTAAASAIRGVAVAGKTGTAQSGTRVNGVELNHAWFAGYAPAEAPKIVVVVMWEFGGHGSRVAHIATAVMEHYLHLTLRPVAATGG